MGAFLDKPITEKEYHVGAGNSLEWACAHMQGWRVSMEVCLIPFRPFHLILFRGKYTTTSFPQNPENFFCRLK